MDSRYIIDEDEGQDDSLAQRGRATRSTTIPNFGVLNEDEQMFLQVGLCSFCMDPLHDEEDTIWRSDTSHVVYGDDFCQWGPDSPDDCLTRADQLTRISPPVYQSLLVDILQ